MSRHQRNCVAFLRHSHRAIMAGVLAPLLVATWPSAMHGADATAPTSSDVQSGHLEQRAESAENRAIAAIQEIHAKSARIVSASGAMAASQKKADEALAGFAAQSVSVDVVLDAQRRHADAAVEYARTVLEQRDKESKDAQLAFHVMELKALENGRDATLAVWRLATAFKNLGVKECGPEAEAQAREQHALFTGLIEGAHVEIAREVARVEYDASKAVNR